MHLSYDGFMRPWLPSYGNVKRFLGPGGVSGWGDGGSQRMCYLTVYRVEVPKYEVLLEVKAGLMEEQQLPQQDKQAGEDKDVGDGGAKAEGQKEKKEERQLVPDARKGTLQLVLPTDGSSVLRLRWTPQAAPAGASAAGAAAAVSSPYPSLFERPADPAAAAAPASPPEPEWDIKLPHVHILFRSVDGSDNRCLMVELAEPCSRTHRGRRRWFFYLQQDWREGKREGAAGIASKLRQLHAVPPLVSTGKKDELKPSGQPLQLGPLPLDLVESIMKGKGDTHQLVRQLHKMILQK